MCGCIVALAGLAFPRLALFLIWLFDLFDDRLSVAFDSFILGFLGFLLLPYTTLFWALAYSPERGVSGIGWFLVVLGFLFDLGSYGGGEYGRRQSTTVA